MPQTAADIKNARFISRAAFFAALGLILPIFFHLFGLGSTFLPMFLPILAGSLLLPWRLAIAIALITPLASFLLTGMPPLYPPVLPVMMLELCLISLIASAIYFYQHYSVWLAIAAAMLADRLFLFFFIAGLAPLFHLPPHIFSVSVVLSGLPGIVLMFLVIPPFINIISRRFPDNAAGAADGRPDEN